MDRFRQQIGTSVELSLHRLQVSGHPRYRAVIDGAISEGDLIYFLSYAVIIEGASRKIAEKRGCSPHDIDPEEAKDAALNMFARTYGQRREAVETRLLTISSSLESYG